MSCPPSERLIEMIDGRLAPSEQDEVEGHIDLCESCRVALSAAVGKDGPAAWTLGRYRIDDMLGAGGMGIVYRAWDPLLSREVAIKVVKSESDELRARLAREAKSLARLNHPNVCQVYDVGIDGAELWIAMELVRGTTMRAWLATKPERAAVLGLLVETGRGLAAAHSAALVHRDVKPENVLVDRTGRAVVSDFGLARDTEDHATRTSSLAGTLAYMAPEQLEGAPANARTDQYAFAVMAHEALTGARPRPRHQASAALPARLRASIARALSEDPAARYASIDQLIATLAIDERSRARLAPFAAAAAAGLLLVGITGAALRARWSTAPDEPGPSVAATPVDAGVHAAIPVARAAALITESIAIVTPVDAGVHAAPADASARTRATVAAAPREVPAPASNDVGAHLSALRRSITAGDGKACLAELAELDHLALPAESKATLGQVSAQCLMVSGQCEAGKKLDRAHWQTMNFTERQLDRQVDSDVMMFCRGGARSDRDRLVRALFVLGDWNWKHTLAECQDAYADAKQLVTVVPSRDSSDILDAAPSRFMHDAPGCFARAGDCALAWTVTKELVSLYKPGATDQITRNVFAWGMHVLCVDQDQGKLTDQEMIWRSLKELDLINDVGTRPAAYCDTRIEQAAAALRRLGERARDPDLKTTPHRLASEAAQCLAVTADCATAWRRYLELSGPGADDQQRRERFHRDVKACADSEP